MTAPAQEADGVCYLRSSAALGPYPTRLTDRLAEDARAHPERGLSAERPLPILSGNDLEHRQLALGAMYAGIPHCPVSPAYSLVSSDYGKLAHIVGLMTPGLIYASGGDALKWVDPERPELGLMFDGRIAEDFKLSSGTFVSVGPLRARIVSAGAAL